MVWEEDETPVVSVILPAAGESTRMGGPVRKPYLPLGGEPILLRTVRAMRALPGVGEVVLAIHPEDQGAMDGPEGDALRAAGVTLAVAGGDNRAESVLRAVEAADPMADLVAIHDAVRPFAPADMCKALFGLAMRRGAAVPILPLADTVKRIEGDTVLETIRRAGLVRVQTPQVVQRDLYIEAAEYARSTGGVSERVTDDASLVEAYGREVAVLHGSPFNLKITTKEDLRIAEAFLAAGLVESV